MYLLPKTIKVSLFILLTIAFRKRLLGTRKGVMKKAMATNGRLVPLGITLPKKDIPSIKFLMELKI